MKNIIDKKFPCDHGQRTSRVFFFKNSKLLGLGRQIGLKFFEAFWGIFGQIISTILAL